MRKFGVDIGFDFYASVAAALLLLPVKWVFAWLTAAAVHELFHCAAIYACRGYITHVKIGIGGASLRTSPLDNRAEMICAVCGPLGGLLIALLFRSLPEFAVCGLAQSVFNLLPIFPMDGGRVLLCACRRVFRQKGERLCWCIQTVFMAGLFMLALYMTFRLLLGPIPVIVAVVLFLRSRKIKTTCKQ